MALQDMISPRTVEVGKVKIGGLGSARKSQKGGTYRMPVKYDHFLVTTLVRNEQGDLAEDKELMEELAANNYADADGKVRALPIFLLSDDLKDSMLSAYLWYNGKKMMARSDGVTVTKFFDPKTLNRLAEPVVSEWQPEYMDLKDGKSGKPLFKLHTTFSFVIASEKARWGGVYRFRTTSRISAEQMYGSLLQISQITCGFLRGVPLLLRVRPMVVTPAGTDKAVTIYVTYCDTVAKSMLDIRQQAVQLAEADVLSGSRMRKLLLEYKRTLRPPGHDETEKEVAEIQAEFHPDPESVTEEAEAPSESDPLMDDVGSEDESLPHQDGNGKAAKHDAADGTASESIVGV